MRQANGFTLVELLVALVVGSTLLAALSWSISTLGRQLRMSEANHGAPSLEGLAPMLEGWIEQIVPPASGDAPIIAETRTLTAVVPPPQALGSVGPVRLTLAVQERADGTALTARMAPAQPGTAFPAIAGGEQILLTGYRDIRFDYVTASDATLPPRLITIRLTSREGVISHLSAAPRMNSTGACRFDPISMTCIS